MPTDPETRQQVTAEVIELGHMLFDAVVDEASDVAIPKEEFPTEEVREAAEEFFARLRELLLEDKG